MINYLVSKNFVETESGNLWSFLHVLPDIPPICSGVIRAMSGRPRSKQPTLIASAVALAGRRVGGSEGTMATLVLNGVGAQTENAKVLERTPPRGELLFRHLIAATRFLECDHSAGHGRHDRSLAASHPPCVRGWQFGDR